MVSDASDPSCVVRFDDLAVTCERSSGKVEQVRWDDLREVTLRTTDGGLSFTDVFWVLTGDSPGAGCVIPQGEEGERELFLRLQQLPGFDNEAVIAAMSSVGDGAFVCWRRPLREA